MLSEKLNAELSDFASDAISPLKPMEGAGPVEYGLFPDFLAGTSEQISG